ncbi:hypothetical protein CBR_g32624 [Chara braunii]|uniref:Uncharacterized protein n=1 Tax=Chara braunii TaxID=69332 RepID=A0A388LH99_CHABU|nr:hypothetical protein CBR_g32624 [Chara braunii]|eukprot:GBG81631.1 hypothetical protein CBR_g32624 [Chara braunii]
MLVPHLLWSTCTELDGDNCYYPSSGHYLVIDVTDLTLWNPIIRRVEVWEEQAEEEREETSGEKVQKEEEKSSETRSDDPDYNESEEAESKESRSDESGGPNESSKEEDEALTQRRRERAKGKRPMEESNEPTAWLLQGDPVRNPELPPEEPEGDGVSTAEGSGSRRRRRSPSSTQSSPPPWPTFVGATGIRRSGEQRTGEERRGAERREDRSGEDWRGAEIGEEKTGKEESDRRNAKRRRLPAGVPRRPAWTARRGREELRVKIHNPLLLRSS